MVLSIVGLMLRGGNYGSNPYDSKVIKIVKNDIGTDGYIVNSPYVIM